MRLTFTTIGEVIRENRKRMKLTQVDLAMYANVSHKFIVELENNKKTIQLDKLFNVLNVFNLTIKIVSQKEDNKNEKRFQNSIINNIFNQLIKSKDKMVEFINNAWLNKEEKTEFIKYISNNIQLFE